MWDNILKRVPSLASVGPWLSGKGALYAGILGFGFGALLIKLNCVPSAPPTTETTSMPYWNIAYLVGFSVIFFILWLASTQVYLRTGRGTRIGLAYDGHNVNVLDWKRTRSTLRDLLKNKHIKNQVTLRFVPGRSILTEEYSKKYMKGYHFAILITVRQSKSINIKNSKCRIEVVTKKEEAKFLKNILPRGFSITRKFDSTLGDLLNAQAHTLHDVLLLFVAMHCYLEKQYKDAAAISKHLDKSLSSVMGPSQELRAQTRLLDINARLRLTDFSVKEMPNPDELVSIRDFAETAMCYFDDSPLVAIAVSRMRFLLSDIDGAIELTERLKNKIDQMLEAGQAPTSRVLPVYFLNSAFLSFIRGDWDRAYDGYHNMLSVDSYRNESWHEIINFIDYVADLEQYDGICYLQTLYRLIARKSVPKELRTEALNWIGEDESRKELRTLLSSNYPSLSSKSEETVRRPEQQRQVKQRSKRKRKPRKKKGR